jgi:hypothetical protein
VLIRSRVAVDQPIASRECVDLLNGVHQVGHAHPSPRRPIPNQIHERMGLIENRTKPAFAKPLPEEADSLDRSGPLIGGEVGFVGLARHRGEQPIPSRVLV